MRRSLYLLTSSLTAAGMLATPLQAYAQAADDAAPYSQGGSEDPPTRVGRLALTDGTVSTHAANEDNWSPATLNAPVANGDAFWTEPSALAKIEVTSSAVWMNGSTEFDLTTLDDTSIHAAEPQGELYLHLRALQPGETFVIETPRGTVTMAGDGRYDLVAGDTDHPTTITVLDGAAQISGNNVSLQVRANQTASITGDTSFQGSVGPSTQDDFVTSMLRREAPAPVQRVAPPPIVAQMTGGEDLNQYGDWQDNADYGQVWYPNVGSDWVPYREGRWSYVAPWGWTWEDSAPWGFAPFHYGRWVQIGPRWGWAPGYPGYSGGYRPAYAPALVSFFGIGAAIGVGVGVGYGLNAAFGPGRNIGWVPLGPREAYYPPYRASRNYLTRVNVTNIRNVTNIYNEAGNRRDLAIDHYANARFATVVPGRTLQDSRPVAGAYRRPTPAELSGARGLVDRAPIAPGAQTRGLTPRAAQALHVADYRQRTAPGPQRPLAETAGTSRLPALRQGHGAPTARPNEAPGPAMRDHAPGGLPALRAPGARPDRVNDARGPATDRPGLAHPGADRTAPNEPGSDRGGAGSAPAPHVSAKPPGQTLEPGKAEHRAPGLRTPGASPTHPGERALPPEQHRTTEQRDQPVQQRQQAVQQRQEATQQHQQAAQQQHAAQERQQQERMQASQQRAQAAQQSQQAAQEREQAQQQRQQASQQRMQMMQQRQQMAQPRPAPPAPRPAAAPQKPHHPGEPPN